MRFMQQGRKQDQGKPGSKIFEVQGVRQVTLEDVSTRDN